MAIYCSVYTLYKPVHSTFKQSKSNLTQIKTFNEMSKSFFSKKQLRNQRRKTFDCILYIQYITLCYVITSIVFDTSKIIIDT